eukprot:3887231-Amphidinium_carterae.1
MAAAPAVEYVAPAPAQYMAAQPVVEYVAPATTYVAPAPPQYVAPTPVVEYVMAPPVAPAMPAMVQHIPSAFVPAGPPTLGARAPALPPKPPVFLPGKVYDIGVTVPVKVGPGVTTAQEKLVGGPPVAPVSTSISASLCDDIKFSEGNMAQTLVTVRLECDWYTFKTSGKRLPNACYIPPFVDAVGESSD